MEHKELKTSVGRKVSDIWAAYQEVLKELKSKEGAPPSTAAVAQQKKVEAAVKTANTVGDLSAVLMEFGRFSDSIKKAKETYDDLELAIAAKRDELKEVHGLEAEANAAVALVAAKDRLIAEKAEQANKVIEKALEDAKAIKAEALEASNHLTEVANEKFKADEQRRVRQAEEWEYGFKRRCQANEDTFQDGIAKRAKAAAEREAAVTEREAKANELDALIKQLTVKLEQCDETTRAAVAKAVAEAEAAASKAAAIQKNIIDRAHAADVSVLNGEIKSLKETNTELRARLERAEAQVNEANNRMTTIATASLRAGADAATVAEVAKVAAGAGGGKK